MNPELQMTNNCTFFPPSWLQFWINRQSGRTTHLAFPTLA
ncbi:hypothetical protein ACVWZ4_004998 [Bradyrhizobium sp. USDA 4472]